MYWVCLLMLGLGVGRCCCGQTIPHGIRDILIPVAVCTLMLAALVAFRLKYFGYPLPNTYYAKVSPDRWYNILEGIKYLVGFGKWHLGVPLCCIAVLAGFLAGVKVIWNRFCKGKTGERGVVVHGVLCGFLIGGLVVAPLVGGDHFAMYRIYQVFWILLPIPFYIWLWKKYTASTTTEKKISLLLLGVLVGLSCRETWWSISPQSRIASEYRIVEKDAQIGQLLNDWFPDSQAPSIGVLSAGAIAFEYNGIVWDLMGLNFSDMAHSPGDKKGQKNHAAFNKDIFWQVTPDIFLPYISTGVQEIIEGRKKQKAKSIANPESDPFKGLRRDKRFIQEYALGVLSKGDGPLLGGVFHRSYLNQLQGFQFQEVPLE
jgi:arabinofuranosyltransferase